VPFVFLLSIFLVSNIFFKQKTQQQYASHQEARFSLYFLLNLPCSPTFVVINDVHLIVKSLDAIVNQRCSADSSCRLI